MVMLCAEPIGAASRVAPVATYCHCHSVEVML